MKRTIVAFLALVSLSAMAKPCDLEIIENIVDGKVGVIYREVVKTAEIALKTGDQVLFEKNKEQATKMMTQVVDLAKTACE